MVLNYLVNCTLFSGRLTSYESPFIFWSGEPIHVIILYLSTDNASTVIMTHLSLLSLRCSLCVLYVVSIVIDTKFTQGSFKHQWATDMGILSQEHQNRLAQIRGCDRHSCSGYRQRAEAACTHCNNILCLITYFTNQNFCENKFITLLLLVFAN